MMEALLPMLLKQFGVDAQVFTTQWQNIVKHHDELCRAINALHQRQIAMQAQLGRIESIICELVPHQDGSTYAEMDPASWPDRTDGAGEGKPHV
jgi:hypothetical protein